MTELVLISLMTVVTLLFALVLIAGLLNFMSDQFRSVLGVGLLVVVIACSAVGFAYAIFTPAEHREWDSLPECAGPPYEVC